MKHCIYLLLLVSVQSIAQTNKSVVIGSQIPRPNALLVLNPPDGNQGFLSPQVTTTKRLSMHPTSPLEDGLLIFDITEKLFYFWKDNTWVKGLGDMPQTLQYDPSTLKLSLSNANEIILTNLKELPITSGNAGKFLTTNGTSVLWGTPPPDAQDLSIAGNVLSLTNDGTSVNLNSLTTNGQITGTINSLTIANNRITNTQIKNNTITVNKLVTSGVTDANKIYSTNGTGIPQLELKSNLLSGVTAGGDLTGTFPTPSVAKIQGNIVSAGILAAGDAGKILVWNGSLWVPQIVNGVSPVSQYSMIDPADFTNLRKFDKKDKDNIIVFDDNSAYVTTIKKAEGPNIIAPVHLPHGATLEQVTLFYMDREVNNITFNLLRKAPTGANQNVINSWSSSGSLASIQSSAHVPIAGNEIIDNNNYSYRIVISLDQRLMLTIQMMLP